MKKIAVQFEDQRHPFRILQRHFEDYVVDSYSEFSPGAAGLSREGLVKDLSDIIKVLCVILIRFCNIRLVMNEANADLFLAPVTDLMVQGRLYDILMRILLEENRNGLERLREKMKAFKGLRLESLKVNKYFCFDPQFRSQFKRRPASADMSSEIKGLLQLGKKPAADTDAREQVMARLVGALRKLKDIARPNRKLGQLLRSGKSLLAEVDRFWSGFEVKSDKLIMDPDTQLSLFIYVIVNSEYAEILVDLKFIDLFITEADKSSTKGYYLVTLTIAVDWITGQDPATFSTVSSSFLTQ